MMLPMNRSRTFWLLLVVAVNAVVAFLWLLLYGWRYSFHLAGLYFGPGMLAVAGMLLGDLMAWFLVSRKSN
jgi:hypothetical protein